MCTLLQVIAVVAVGAYLYLWRASAIRRRSRTWDEILARLSPDWNLGELCDQCFCKEEERCSLARKLRRISNAHGLWAMYRNAGVMMEMADYAALNSDSVAQETLMELRSDATRIRLCVLKALTRIAIGAASENLCLCALQAESAYAEMVQNITCLLEENAGKIVPEFIAAM